jgi:hypothetical protein
MKIPKHEKVKLFGIIDNDLAASIAKRNLSRFLLSGRGRHQESDKWPDVYRKVFKSRKDAEDYKHRYGIRRSKVITFEAEDLIKKK